MDHLCYLCLVLFMHSRLFIAALCSTAGKGLTSQLLFVLFNCVTESHVLAPFILFRNILSLFMLPATFVNS